MDWLVNAVSFFWNDPRNDAIEKVEKLWGGIERESEINDSQTEEKQRDVQPKKGDSTNNCS